MGRCARIDNCAVALADTATADAGQDARRACSVAVALRCLGGRGGGRRGRGAAHHEPVRHDLVDQHADYDPLRSYVFEKDRLEPEFMNSQEREALAAEAVPVLI